MNTLLKWPGGKSRELRHIKPKMPERFRNYIEPFFGGGALYFSLEENVNHMIINDLSSELISFYKCIKNNDNNFFDTIRSINEKWNLINEISHLLFNDFERLYREYTNDIITYEEYKERIMEIINNNNNFFQDLVLTFHESSFDSIYHHMEMNIKRKPKYMRKQEEKNGVLNREDLIKNFETALKSGYYGYIRQLYNTPVNTFEIGIESAVFYFIREYCYSSMFRYNSNGEFNVPYGGMSYNNKIFSRKIDYISTDLVRNRLNRTDILNLDFEDFLNSVSLSEEDFIFLDPPYDSVFSTYAENIFGEVEHRRLADFLSNTNAMFMLVIKSTPLIESLYRDTSYWIYDFENEYLVSFKDRNNKNSQHLLITNYEIDL